MATKKATAVAATVAANANNANARLRKWAVGGWSFFIAETYVLTEYKTYITHELLSSDERMYSRLCDACSIIACGSILYGFKRIRSTAAVRVPSPLRFVIGAVLWGFGSALLTLPTSQIPATSPDATANASGNSAVSSSDNANPNDTSSKVRDFFDFVKERTSSVAVRIGTYLETRQFVGEWYYLL